MRYIILLFAITIFSSSFGQNLLLKQPTLDEVRQFEKLKNGIATIEDAPSLLNADSYPYIDKYKIREPKVFVSESSSLNITRKYYSVEGDKTVRYLSQKWGLFKPNIDEKEKKKILKNDELTLEEYFLMFDSLELLISQQLDETPSERNKQDTIYNDDGSVYYYYKSTYWNTPNRYLRFFCTYSDNVRNIRLNTYWMSNEDTEWLNADRNEKIYKIIELEVDPMFSKTGLDLYRYLFKYFKPKSKVSKKDGDKIFTAMVIDSKGKVTDVRIMKGINPDYNAELKAFLLALPNWQPGKLNNQSVSSEMTIMIPLIK